MASRLKQYELKNFSLGYNSYSQSKSLIKDQEFPYGVNVYLDDNGSVTKRPGSTRYGPQVVASKAIMGGSVLQNGSTGTIIISAGTAWYNYTTTTSTALTGTAFTDSKRTRFCQALSNLYGANNTDNLAYTTNGTSVVFITANGNVGDWPTFYNQRMYMTNATYADRIYYSNPFGYSTTSSAFGSTTVINGFDDANMFNTDLTSTPKKNAGFIILLPGAGLQITGLFQDGDSIYAYTKRHGIWKIVASATVNSDGSIAHTISQTNTYYSTPSGQSVIKVANDQWFFGYDNVYSLGEVALYNNIRVSTKSGRIKSEMNSIAVTGTNNVALGFFKSKVFVAYQSGSYNDRMVVYDAVLNAWGAPFQGINANFFFQYVDSSGTPHFLAGSSNSADPYIYELQSGTDDAGTAISAEFESKSTDCGEPGLVKRFGFIDVAYGLVYGTLTYQVFIDEVVSLTGSLQLGNSASASSGIGSQVVGTFPVGAEYTVGTTFASTATNGYFRIPCNFTAGKKISVRFTNNNVGEQFKINSVIIHFINGSIYE